MSYSNAIPAAADLRGRSSSAATRRLRPAIADVLARLKRQIRVYVLIEGAALLAVVVGSLFWLSLAVDWAYFRTTALELPLWFREAAAIVAIALLAAGVMFWIVLRFFARLRARGLALVLERRFPELGTRLISAVELAEANSGHESPLTAAMIERTMDEAVRMAAALPIESVFNRAPLRQSLVTAAVLAASIGGFVLVDRAAAARWYKAFVARDAVYWPRETQLVVKAVVQPGNRVREFRNGLLKHPRGVDLVLLVEAPENSKVPALIELRYVLDGGRGYGRIDMVKSGDRQFRHTISGLLDGLSLWVSGGDYVSRTPLRVEVVDPPRLDRVTFDCDYPDYTGLGRDGQGTKTRQTVDVQGSQVALPMETSFVLHAKANKPLAGLRIETPLRRISLASDRSSVAWKTAAGETGPEQPLSAPAAERFLSSDGFQAAVPFVLTAKAPKESEVPSLQGNAKTITDRAANRLPLAIPADCRLRIELEDTDGIVSVEPIRLVVNGIVDQPPAVHTELRGIGTAITRKATIPLMGTITDDYGLAKARFEFRIGAEKDWRPRPFWHPPAGNPKEYALRQAESDPLARFEVLPLELKVGQRLALSVFAEDGDNLNGPHASRGEEYVFQIVSDEELLSVLYVKEVNLRERFEKIISELEKVQKDLVDHRARANDSLQAGSGSRRTDSDGSRASTGNSNGDSRRDTESLGDLQTSIQVCAVRSLTQLRKNSVETASIEESFRGLLEELVNNAVHTQQMVDRIGKLIVEPLHLANEKEFPAADEAIGLFKLAADEKRDAIPPIDSSVRAVGTLIARLKMALGEMKDLVKFHEAISRLQGLIKDQEQIIDSTKEEQKKNRLKELRSLEQLK